MSSSGALRPALTNEVYEFLGRANQQLIAEVRRDRSDLHGPDLALAVLRVLRPDLSVTPARARDYFRNWVDDHRGERPGVAKRERAFGMVRSEERMETEDLRWVGLAVLVGVAGGALLVHLNRRRPQAAGPAPRGSPPPPSQAPVCFALAAFSGKMREVGTQEANAGDLLTHAAFWWAGTRERWGDVVRGVGASPLRSLPDGNDDLVLAVYEAPPAGGGVPSSRPEGASRLRDAAAARELRSLGLFSVNRSELTAVGFKR